MSQRPLPTPWNVYNLSQSPYFQGPLEASEHTPRPLRLFVGRADELATLLGRIRGAGENGTVQAIAGAPGVGKTTLVKGLKARALADGYLTTDSYVPIYPEDTTETLFGRVLGALYDTILANRPQSGGNTSMRDAAALVRVHRLASGGASLSIPLVGGLGFSHSTSVITPRDILIDGPRVMRDLTALVQSSEARGALIHVNNLENLSESDAVRAADMLRALRDTMLMWTGLHYVLVGTQDAVAAAVTTHAQVRSIVSILPLAPLSIADVHELLSVRYAYLRLDSDEPVIPPVDAEAVSTIYDFFRGDLRGLLKALEDGVLPLIGLATTPTRSLGIGLLRSVLRQRYDRELAQLAEARRVSQLRAWGYADPAGTQTQQSLKRLWDVKSQSTVSEAVSYLVRQGYVVVLPRTDGREATQYALSGVSRLIFG